VTGSGTAASSVGSARRDPARVFLARHGSARMPDADGRIWNYSDAELTEVGLAQATELGEALREVDVDAIYTSDLLRARQTSEVIGRATGAPIAMDRRLREVDIGEHEGTTLARLRERHHEFVPWLEIAFGARFPQAGFRIPASLRFPGGESVTDMLDRALPSFLEIARQRQGQTVVLVAHQWLVQALLCHIVAAGVDRYDRFAVPQASLTFAEVAPDGRGVLYVLNGRRRLTDAAGGRVVRSRSASRAAPDPDAKATCRLFLIRHGHAMRVEEGEPVYSHRPVPLTDTGEEQARRLARVLTDVPLDAIYTSDLLRASQTAETVAAGREVAPTVEPGLREVSLGDFEGMTLERVRAEHPRFAPWLEVAFAGTFPTEEFHHPADLRFPSGESVLDIHERVRQVFRRIVKQHLGGNVAIVAHGWVIQPLLCSVVGCPPTEYFRLLLGYATVTLVEVDEDGHGVLEMLNGRLPLLETAGGRLGPGSSHTPEFAGAA
jgi:broad specificity phosphatase PhoE